VLTVLGEARIQPPRFPPAADAGVTKTPGPAPGRASRAVDEELTEEGLPLMSLMPTLKIENTSVFRSNSSEILFRSFFTGSRQNTGTQKTQQIKK
jgi:hypothetical protein